ncbi:MAG: hypothetical protein COA74_10650 [Gammaproteobacteria bacterium]|nr:MAG: hypothetical protein COA74_10650 [Gammaproteobacteria bacterium]
MRQISIHRVNAKVRGIPRRLRALEKWAEDFEQTVPIYEHQKYWNYKIPVLDRLVNQPTTNFEIQSKALSCLIIAAAHLAKSPLKEKLPYYKVAVLLVLPDMFSSEVTVFFDKNYYDKFYYTDNLLSDNQKPSSQFEIDIPSEFSEVGTIVKWKDEDDNGQTITFSEERWTIGQQP